MGINFRKVGLALVLASMVELFLFPGNLIAQAEAKDQESKQQIVLSKLFPPVYPPLARQALIFGDVHLRVSIHSDGSLNSATVIDGPLMLRQAALESARQSQFECEHCEGSGLVEMIFTYAFRIPGVLKPVDSSCCLEEQGQPGKPSNPVSQSGELITIIAPAVCECSDEYRGTLMDRRMRLIAGNDALDCGRVKLNGDSKASLRCARKAISHKRAFVVRFDYSGMDSSFSDGFAGDGSGKVYSVRFDSMGWSHSPGVEILDSAHDAVEICPKPVHIKARSAPKGTVWGYRCTREER